MTHPLTSDTRSELSAREEGRVRRLFRSFWVPMVLVVVALGYAGGIAAQHSSALSPIDEWVYVDYLHKLPSQGMLQQGEAIGDEALDMMACHGVFPYGPMGPDCGDEYDDLTEFPFGGITSADPYTPAYFAVTRVVGDLISLAPGVDPLTGWRMTGALWLAGSMVVLWLLLRQWRVAPVVSLGLGLAFIASPFSWWTYTYVSTDAPSFLAGAALLFVTARFLQGRGAWWWIPILSVTAVLFKVTNILAVGLAALYLLTAWVVDLWKAKRAGRDYSGPERQSKGWTILAVAVGSAVAAIALQLGWLRLHSSLASGAPAEQGISGALDLRETLSQMAYFLPGTITANVNLAGSFVDYALPVPGFAVAPLSWLTVAGVVGSFWALRAVNARTPLVIAIGVSAVTFAPILAVALYVTTGSYFPLPPRYGAPILAGFLLAAGITIRNRWAGWILVGYAGLLMAGMIFLTALLGD